MKKYYLIAAGLLLIAAGLIIATAPGKLEIYFFDVGQGDAALIRTPSGGTVLIDGGPDRRILRHLGKALPFGKRNLDLMILSHPHADHVTGLVGVLERYQVKRVLATGALHTTAEYLEWLKQIKEQNIPWQTALAGQTLSLSDGVRLQVLLPPVSLVGQRVPDLNASSAVVRLVYGNTSVLFTGDINIEQEQELIGAGSPINAQLLKVPHHGSHFSSSLDFIRAVKPVWAVISVGANNRYGHPHGEIVARYQQAGVKVLRTDQLGTIRFSSDGQNWQQIKRWGLLNF